MDDGGRWLSDAMQELRWTDDSEESLATLRRRCLDGRFHWCHPLGSLLLGTGGHFVTRRGLPPGLGDRWEGMLVPRVQEI
jgi:hypothetical protein